MPGTFGAQWRPVGGLAHRTIGPYMSAEGARQHRRRLRGDHRSKREPRRQHQQQQQQQRQH